MFSRIPIRNLVFLFGKFLKSRSPMEVRAPQLRRGRGQSGKRGARNAHSGTHTLCCFVFVCLRAPTQSGRSYLKRFERRGCCAKAFALCVCVCVCEFLIMMCMTCWRFGNQEHVNADACTHARAMQASRGPSGWIDITSFRWAPRGTTTATTDRRQFTCFSNSATGGLANPGTS